ncbi:hypothetical protein B0181_01005 [Moraxella caviae]|uniref:Uncharacterized protein n=1 Tax=Moraxella caviae TaxID=34060 RepID=A0A1T0ABD5_9GAMM|nr:hypothetical protein B0181_01005 [Moraxella caviae]
MFFKVLQADFGNAHGKWVTITQNLAVFRHFSRHIKVHAASKRHYSKTTIYPSHPKLKQILYVGMLFAQIPTLKNWYLKITRWENWHFMIHL